MCWGGGCTCCKQGCETSQHVSVRPHSLHACAEGLPAAPLGLPAPRLLRLGRQLVPCCAAAGVTAARGAGWRCRTGVVCGCGGWGGVRRAVFCSSRHARQSLVSADELGLAPAAAALASQQLLPPRLRGCASTSAWPAPLGCTAGRSGLWPSLLCLPSGKHLAGTGLAATLFQAGAPSGSRSL